MSRIHPSAYVDASAEIGKEAEIGPFCRIEGPVRIGARARLMAHVTALGCVEIGEDCRLHPFVCLGAPPQDARFADRPGMLRIGPRTVLREQVTMHPGFASETATTSVGAGGLFMVAAHVGHDCAVGDCVTFANHASLGGGCRVGDNAILGGFTAVHPNVRIGRHAFIGGGSMVLGDVIPFGSVYGARARLNGLNLVGLKRRNFDRDLIRDLRAAYRLLTAKEGAVAERLTDIADLFAHRPEVMEVVDFARAESARNLCLA